MVGRLWLWLMVCVSAPNICFLASSWAIPHPWWICIKFIIIWQFIGLSSSLWDSQVVLVVKDLPVNGGDVGLISESARSPGERNGNLIYYSCWENPMDREAWWVTVCGFQRVRHDWACTHTLHAYIVHLDTLTNSEKHVYEFVFLANIWHLVFICKVICSKKETPSIGVDPHVKPSRVLESSCSQVALFLCHTGNYPF